MRHRLRHKVFAKEESPQKSRTTSTFTTNSGGNPHSAKQTKLHSKSTYFYNDDSSSGKPKPAARIFHKASFLGCAGCNLRERELCNTWHTRNEQRRTGCRWNDRAVRRLPRLTYVVPSVCTLALLLGGIVAINPDTNQVYANSGDESNDGVDTGVMPLAADSSLSLTFDGTPTLTTEVTAGKVSYLANKFTVTANKHTQFTVKLEAMNGSGTELHGKTYPNAIITGVPENTTPNNFANNTWGYAITENTSNNPTTTAQSLSYNPMPAYGTPKSIVTKQLTGSPNETQQYLLAFAAKIGTNSPADHYIGNFLLSVVGDAFNPNTYTLTYNANNGTGAPSSQSCTQASVSAACNITITAGTPSRNGFTFLGWGDNPTDTVAKYSAGSTITMSANKTIYAVWKQDATFMTITTMQEMTSTICKEAEVGATKQLVDARAGNKRYWVAKLADGNCWMTQNLDYDIESTLTASSTDVLEDTTISATKFTNTDGISGWRGSSGSIQYYDPGLIVKNNPATTNACSGSSITTLTNSACVTNGWQNVSTLTARTATSSNGNEPVNTSSSVISGNSYDAHYLVGNYYSWPAAVAGTGSTTGSIDGAQAAGSICPKGWKLPTTSNLLGTTQQENGSISAGTLDSFNTPGSFAYLLRQYGLSTAYNASSITGTKGGKTYNIYDAPLYYLRAGYIDQHDDSPRLSDAGSGVKYWTSVVKSGPSAYWFDLSDPSATGGRWHGGTIRCVAR